MICNKSSSITYHQLYLYCVGTNNYHSERYVVSALNIDPVKNVIRQGRFSKK